MCAELRVPIEHATYDPLLIDSPWELVNMMIDHQGATVARQGAIVTRQDIATDCQGATIDR
jgi:hypothetical protein